MGRELQVHPDELAAAIEALRYVHDLPAFPLHRAARSALAKLTFDLAPETLHHPPGVLHFSSFDRVAVGEALSLASEAMARRKTLHFEYFSIGRNHRSRRSAHPLGLLYQGSRWYLVGQDLENRETRMFRVDRMEEVELEERCPRTPDFEVPEGFSLDAYRGRRRGSVGGAGARAAGEGSRRRPGRGVPGFSGADCRSLSAVAPGPPLHGEDRLPASLRERLEELRMQTLEVHR